MIVDLINWDFRVVLQDYLAWSICVAALIWGAGPERATAITWLLMFELAPAGYDYFVDGGHYGENVDVFYATTDVIAGISWITIALYANRNYTLVIAAMQVLAVCSHLASGIAEPISPIGYSVMAIAPSWVQLIVLATGLIRHILRKRTHGRYRDWRLSEFPTSPNDDNMLTKLLGDSQASWRDELK